MAEKNINPVRQVPKKKLKKSGGFWRAKKSAPKIGVKKNLGGGGVRQRLAKKITKITKITKKIACGAWKNAFFYNIKTSKITTKKSLAAKGTASPVILISRSSYKSGQLY